MPSVPVERESVDIETHTGKMPCEDEGRDWGGVSKSQETANTARKPPEASGEARDRSSLIALRRNQLE